MVAGPEPNRSARWCMEALITMEDASVTNNVVVSAGESALEVSAHERPPDSDGFSVTIELLDETDEARTRRLTT